MTRPGFAQVTMDEAQYQRQAPEIALALAAPHVRDVFEASPVPLLVHPMHAYHWDNMTLCVHHCAWRLP